MNNDLNFETDVVMFATGHEPYVDGRGLETVDVELNERGKIVVNGESRTRVELISAVGDVSDQINLTLVAILDGRGLRPGRVP